MIDHLSQSMMKSWLDCKARFYNEYILGIKLWEPAFEQGTDYHKSVENYHLHGTLDPLVKPYTDAVAADDYQWVERKFRMHLKHPETGEPLALPFTGIVDRLDKQGHLRDYKTSSVSWSQNRADKDIQATIYTYAYWQSTGKIVPFHFDVQRKDWKEGRRIAPFMTVQTERDLWHFKSMWLLANKMIADIYEEEEWPCMCRDHIHQLEYA